MKKVLAILITGLFLFAAGSMPAQKVTSGDLMILKGEKVVNFQYDWSKMKVGKFDKEADYIKQGIEDRNAKKPGSGDEWATKWNDDKTFHFQPVFMKEFNQSGDKCGLTAKENFQGPKYTFIIRTLFLEQGFQTIEMGGKPGYINLQIDIVESANPEKILVSISYPKIYSKSKMGFNVDTGTRIASCYERAGDELAGFICKTLSK